MKRITQGLLIVVAAAGVVALAIQKGPEERGSASSPPAQEELYRLGQNPGGKTQGQLWTEAEKLGEEYSEMVNQIEQLKRDHERKKTEGAKVQR